MTKQIKLERATIEQALAEAKTLLENGCSVNIEVTKAKRQSKDEPYYIVKSI